MLATSCVSTFKTKTTIYYFQRTSRQAFNKIMVSQSNEMAAMLSSETNPVGVEFL